MIILPSLEIVPAKYNTSTNTLLSQIPIDGTGDFTVTRATSPTTGRSTRVNALGQIELVADNVPRLDYPLGGAVNGCPALLVEPSASNLLWYSDEFNNVYWSKSFGTVTQDQTTAPNGLTTADKYVVTSGASSNSPIVRTFTFAINTTYTLSLFVKKADYDTASIRLNTNETGLITNSFNLALGTATNNQIQNYGNGWYRVWVTFTTAATVTNGQVQLIRDAEVRDGVAGIFVWGAQLEIGSVATSYIPTTIQSITRAADVITDTTASGVIGQTEGAIYAEFEHTSNTAERRLIALSDGTVTNRIFIWGQNNILYAQIQGNSVIIANPIPSGYNKVAFAYQQNGVSGNLFASINGGAVVSGTSTTYPSTLSRVAIGSSENAAAGVFQWNNRIRAAALYPTRLTNTQLALLTSPYTSYSSMASALSYTLG